MHCLLRVRIIYILYRTANNTTFLNEPVTELKKLKESKLIEDQSVMARTRTGARVHWPWRIECGQCHVGLLLRYDANTSGRIRRFRNGISLFKIFILTRAISDC